MNINKNKYCCLYIPIKKKNFCFDIILDDKNLSKIIDILNNDMKISFKIKNYIIDKKYGILLMDNLIINECNKLFVCHFLNLLNFVNNNITLVNNDNLLNLYNNFLLNNSINEK